MGKPGDRLRSGRLAGIRVHGTTAVVAAIVGVGAVAMAVQSGSPADPSVRTNPQAGAPPPDAPGLTMMVAPGVGARLSADPLLRRAPWLFQRGASPSYRAAPELPSLVYPRGTTYSAAVTQLIGAVGETGALPRGARLGPPLPDGVVFSTQTATREPALDLRAPMGFDPDSGAVAAPVLSFPSSMSADEVRRAARGARGVRAVPEGVRVAVPVLPGCQVAGPAPADMVLAPC